MVVDQPLQKGDALPRLVLRNARRRGFELLDDLDHAFAHRSPVLDGGPDVPKHRGDALLDLRQRIGRALLVDLDMDHRFQRAVAGLLGEPLQLSLIVPLHREDGVHDKVHGEVAPREFRGDGIDEKRHVVVDDLHHRMGGIPAILFELRIIDPDRRLARRAVRREVPEGERRAEEVFRVPADDIVRRDIAVEGRDKRLELGDPRLGHPLPDFALQLVDDFALQVFRIRCHRTSPSESRPAAFRSGPGRSGPGPFQKP